MKKFRTLALVFVVAATGFAATIDISTGIANWQVFNGGFVAATTLTAGQQNGTWAPPPSGSDWISYGSVQGTSCVVGQTPGNGCANANINPAGDIWQYDLTLSAAALGATSGTLNFVFGADNRVQLFVGNGSGSEDWGTGNPGTGYDPLGCSGTPPTSAGNTQTGYNNCTGTVAFNASSLNGDGSLTLIAYTDNDPITGCPACGNPTGFVLEGTVSTGATATPEPATFSLFAAAGIAAFAFRRKFVR